MTVGVFAMKNLILPILLLISGCASSVIVDPNTYPHMILLDKNGESVAVKKKKEHDESKDHHSAGDIKKCEKDKDKKLCRQLEAIRANLKDFLKDWKDQDADKYSHVRKEIMIYIHGGLASKKDSSKASTTLHNAIVAENQLCMNDAEKKSCKIIYPIFINWESGMGSAYADHLFSIRQGKESPVLGPITSPFYFIADVGRAITRLPITYSWQAYDAVRDNYVADKDDIEAINKEFYGSKKNGGEVSLGFNLRSKPGIFADKATYIFPGVFKLLTTPILDTVGKSAWDNMLRRTKTVFRRPDDYHGKFGRLDFNLTNIVVSDENENNITELFSKKDSGGVSRLLEIINEASKSSGNIGNSKSKFTLIGHSMGAIISSRILSKLLESKQYPAIHFDNIVFMAAASTIRQFEDNVIPYLQKHDETRFYNLTLHPYTEENEQTGFDSVPRGSLLVWIDNYSASPDTISDFTFGKWNNALSILPFVPKNIRHRVSLKGFGVYDKSINRIGSKGKYNKPQKHGQFNDVDQCFWREEYWQPTTSGYKDCMYLNKK